MIVKQNKKTIIGLIYVTVLTGIALVYGFSIIPSPSMERNLTADHKRVTDLGYLQQAIDNYYQNNGVLPESLKEITSNTYDPSSPLDKTDPQTKVPYEYKQVDSYTYKLCALFQTSSKKENTAEIDTSNPSYSNFSSQFTHGIGYHCFTENESGASSNDIPVPTMTCLGGGCPVTPTPPPDSPTAIPAPVQTPTATLSSFESIGTCHWTPTFTLYGFTPNSYINVTSSGTLSDQCNPNKTHKYTWTAGWPQETDSDGGITINYSQTDYGDYTYTFSDEYGNSATVHYQNSPTAGPTIIPSGGGGGGSAGSDM